MTTITKPATEFATDILMDGTPLLPQVVALLDNAYRAGKDAYDLLAELRSYSAVKIAMRLSQMGIHSIKTRDLTDPMGAALAVATAALLDGSRGTRATGVERIDLAMDILAEQLAADW